MKYLKEHYPQSEQIAVLRAVDVLEVLEDLQAEHQIEGRGRPILEEVDRVRLDARSRRRLRRGRILGGRRLLLRRRLRCLNWKKYLFLRRTLMLLAL